MSIVRSAYRQILRVGARTQKSYEDPNDLCFAIFGILLNRNDFANAGYGTSFAHVVRHAFERPSVSEDLADTPSARLQASFSFLRRLHELTQYKTPREVRQRRTKVLNATGVAAASTLHKAPEDEDVEVNVKDGHATITKKLLRPSTSAAAEKSEKEGAAVNDEDEDGDMDEEDEDDEHALVGTTTLFINRLYSRKVQQEVRHVVVSKVHTQFPPYAYLLPPEPMYPLTLRQELPFLLCKDAIACLAATSAVLQHQQAKRESEEAAELGYTPKKARGREGVALAPSISSGAGSRCPVTFQSPVTAQDFQRLLESVPTRAIARTDFMEIEICTQYVCSHSTTGSGTSPLPDTAATQRLHAQKGNADKTDDSAKLFMCYVFIRNLPPSQNPKLWHAQILSRHSIVLDPQCSEVVEMTHPGVVGNFPLLAPGESHVFETGTSQYSADGILRGTLQVTAFNEEGQIRMMDVAIPPVRLSTRVFESPGHKSQTTQKSTALKP